MNHDEETTDTWTPCPWCGEEYSVGSEPCIAAATMEVETLKIRPGLRQQRDAARAQIAVLEAERDALTAENERIRADIAQGSDDRARMAKKIKQLMLIIISEGIDPYVYVPGGLSRTELRAENERLRKEIVRLFEVASGEQYESGNPAILAMIEIQRLRGAINHNPGEGK